MEGNEDRGTESRGSPVNAGAVPVVVLAGGAGRRFDGVGHKLAQGLGESTVLVQTLSRVVEAGLPLVVVTTAPLVPLARTVVAARDIVLVQPDDSAAAGRTGLGYSIAAGVSACAHAPGWLLLPADMPLVQPATLLSVRRALGSAPIVRAQHRGWRGHPIAFSQELFTELCMLTSDDSVRRLLSRYPGSDIDVEDDGIRFDVDTLATLTAARDRLAHTLEAQRQGAMPSMR